MSERTIYRDIRDLSISDVLIEGEAEAGYRVKASYELKPLMFLPNEMRCYVQRG